MYIFIKDATLTLFQLPVATYLIKITCSNTYAKYYQQSSQALQIRSAGYIKPAGL